MVNYICARCGVQYAATASPPGHCAICEDEREAVYREGQRWTTLADLRRDLHNVIQQLEPGLIGIYAEPRFAIGQQALLIRTPEVAYERLGHSDVSVTIGIYSHVTARCVARPPTP